MASSPCVSCPAEPAASGFPRLREHDVVELVAAAARGDQRAWTVLVGRYGATIRSVARRHRLAPADQDEVAQRTWLRLVEHIATVREPAALGGWLATTARHECLRVIGSSVREVPIDESAMPDVAEDAAIHEAVEAAERGRALHGALDRLPDHQRTVVRLLLDEPALSYDDVSATLGIPRGSIGPTRARGLSRLRRDPHLASAVDRRTRFPGHDLY
jgi:RNA polymerase sigma factor (sigma-70 family)